MHLVGSHKPAANPLPITTATAVNTNLLSIFKVHIRAGYYPLPLFGPISLLFWVLTITGFYVNTDQRRTTNNQYSSFVVRRWSFSFIPGAPQAHGVSAVNGTWIFRMNRIKISFHACLISTYSWSAADAWRLLCKWSASSPARPCRQSCLRSVFIHLWRAASKRSRKSI
jgi:hypothetical protein